MNNLRSLMLAILFSTITMAGMAQGKKETFKVSGECGMCKSKIESAAKKAGATFAAWDEESKVLTVSYKKKKTNATTIQQSIAYAGYDTPSFKATDEAYNKLHACCKYERDASVAGCGSEKCIASGCMKDGGCDAGKDCCKESGCDKKDCCKKGHSSSSSHNAKDGKAVCTDAKASCCKKA